MVFTLFVLTANKHSHYLIDFCNISPLSIFLCEQKATEVCDLLDTLQWETRCFAVSNKTVTRG